MVIESCLGSPTKRETLVAVASDKQEENSSDREQVIVIITVVIIVMSSSCHRHRYPLHEQATTSTSLASYSSYLPTSS